jgi:hypothetical protein
MTEVRLVREWSDVNACFEDWVRLFVDIDGTVEGHWIMELKPMNFGRYHGWLKRMKEHYPNITVKDERPKERG